MVSELIIRIKEGDETAFKQFIEMHQGSVYSVCVSMLCNAQDAEDVAQDVFITFYQNINDFRGDSSPKTWIHRVAINKCLDELRKRKRQKRWAGVMAIFLGEDESNHPVEFDHPGVQLENREQAEILHSHIDRLSENQRVAFTMHKIQGIAYIKIAEVMNLSVSSVESLIFRANTNLRKSLRGYYESI